MAKELGKQLHEVMGWPGPLTRLQFLAWNAWLTMDLEQPSRADMYVMQLTHEVAAAPGRVWGKDHQVPLDTYRLRAKDAKAEVPQAKASAIYTDTQDIVLDPSSQETCAGPTLPPMVTAANKAAIEAKIAVAIKLAAAKQVSPNLPMPKLLQSRPVLEDR